MGDALQSKAYLRYLSTNIRKWTPKRGKRFIEEDPVIGGVEGLARSIMIVTSRNRQRVLQQAWDYWTGKSGVVHDYTDDMIAILSHPIPENEMRSEIEVEVMFKWVRQQADSDFTGIAHTIKQCKSRKTIITVLQNARMESFNPGEPILFQGTLPKPEDGHFTILRGTCDVLMYATESVAYLRMQDLVKWSRFESAKQLLSTSTILAEMVAPAGFGELSTLTGVKRAATVRASYTLGTGRGSNPNAHKSQSHVSNSSKVNGGPDLATQGDGVVDVMVVPDGPLLECLEARRSADNDDGYAPSEAIELFRQTGLAGRIEPKELMKAAQSMVKRTLYSGDVLFEKGAIASKLYIVVSGELLLDVSDTGFRPVARPDGSAAPPPGPFVHSPAEQCFHISGGTMLGDEGILGFDEKCSSTAAVMSERAVIFEAAGFARKFLVDRIKAMRYAALAYKDLPRWTIPIGEAESNNLYGNLNSLRKVIAQCRPWRGTTENWHIKDEDLSDPHFKAILPMVKKFRQDKAIQNKNKQRKDLDPETEKKNVMKAAIIKKKSDAKKMKKPKRESSLNNQTAAQKAKREFILDQPDSGLNLKRLSQLSLGVARSHNNASKKILSESVQVHARVNILQDQLLREEKIEKNHEKIYAALKDEGEGEGGGGSQTTLLVGSMTSAASASTSKPSQINLSKMSADADHHTRAKARRAYVKSVTAKLHASLQMYKDRQEEYVEEEKEDEGEHIRISEVAQIMSMFKSAAAGAMNDNGEGKPKNVQFTEGEEGEGGGGGGEGEGGTSGDGASVITTSTESSILDVLEMYRPRIEAYLENMDENRARELARLRASGPAGERAALRATTKALNMNNDVAEVDMEEFKSSDDPSENNTGTNLGHSQSYSVLNGTDTNTNTNNKSSPLRDLRDPRTQTMQKKKNVYVNETNWRPPSPPALSGSNERGEMLVKTFSKPTTRETLKNFGQGQDLSGQSKSIWKKKHFEHQYSRGVEEDVEKEAARTHQGLASLLSLEFKLGERHYRTHADRMKGVDSSGYGQKHIEEETKKELGMTYSEAKEVAEFYRMPPPTTMRRIVMSEAMGLMLNPTNKKNKPKSKSTYNKARGGKLAMQGGEAVDINDMNKNIGEFEGEFEGGGGGVDAEGSMWSVDLDSPAGFIDALRDKDFSTRKRFLERNGWNTRSMKVSNNSTEIQENGSAWFQNEIAKMGILVEEDEEKEGEGEGERVGRGVAKQYDNTHYDEDPSLIRSPRKLRAYKKRMVKDLQMVAEMMDADAEEVDELTAIMEHDFGSVPVCVMNERTAAVIEGLPELDTAHSHHTENNNYNNSSGNGNGSGNGSTGTSTPPEGGGSGGSQEEKLNLSESSERGDLSIYRDGDRSEGSERVLSSEGGGEEK